MNSERGVTKKLHLMYVESFSVKHGSYIKLLLLKLISHFRIDFASRFQNIIPI